MKYEVFHQARLAHHTCRRPNGFMIWLKRIRPGDAILCKACQTVWVYKGAFGMYITTHEWEKMLTSTHRSSTMQP